MPDRMSPVDLPPERVVTCPSCRGPARYDRDNRWRPFCSARCRGVDLGAWASESFRLPVGDNEPPEDPAPGGAAPGH